MGRYGFDSHSREAAATTGYGAARKRTGLGDRRPSVKNLTIPTNHFHAPLV